MICNIASFPRTGSSSLWESQGMPHVYSPDSTSHPPRDTALMGGRALGNSASAPWFRDWETVERKRITFDLTGNAL